jgi:non-homologous end joining protein Ku
MTERASIRTTLAFGTVRKPVALFKAWGDPPDLPEFVQAGPTGGKLHRYPVGDTELYRSAATEWRTDDPVTPGADAFGDAVATQEAAPVETQLIEEGSGEVVEEPRRGIRMADGAFVDLTDQLREIEDATRLDEMEIIGFVGDSAVQRHRVKAAYYVGTDGQGSMQALRYLHAGMRAAGRCAVAKVTKKTRQSLMVLVPYTTIDGNVLIALDLHWSEEWRQAPIRAQLDSAPVMPEGVAAATELVRAMAVSPHVVAEAEDDAVRLRRDLVMHAAEGSLAHWPGVRRRAEPSEEETVEQALRESVAAVET